MVCYYCDGITAVTNSRKKIRLKQIWRRRQCKKCLRTFTTVEQIDFEKALSVDKGMGHSEPFLRHKLCSSIIYSLGHRKNAVYEAGPLTDTIISKILSQNHSALIDSKQISQITGLVLKRFDRTAAVHYSAYHSVN
ncbi:MAG TPA: hypothetical protein VMR34_06055 [Candidatus Saccharimonadales bacterium]|nr:hypothetical protein [Candidatus Saccharimonadales bacterium]